MLVILAEKVRQQSVKVMRSVVDEFQGRIFSPSFTSTACFDVLFVVELTSTCTCVGVHVFVIILYMWAPYLVSVCCISCQWKLLLRYIPSSRKDTLRDLSVPFPRDILGLIPYLDYSDQSDCLI